MNKFENVGRFMGEHLGKRSLNYFRDRVENFQIETGGIENLQSLADRPYLLVSNHIKPKSATTHKSGLMPDGLILENVVKKYTGRTLKVVKKSDGKWWKSSLSEEVAEPPKGLKYLDRNIVRPVTQGFHEGAGFIPIQKNKGSSKRRFVEVFGHEVRNGNPILIFPEGHGYDEFTEDRELEDGASVMAARYNLPIVPSYIEGADAWQKGQQVKLLFGKHFEPAGADPQQITALIKQNILDLKKSMHQKS